MHAIRNLLAVLLLALPPAFAGQPAVELGRSDKAMPWLESPALADEPFEVAPLASVAFLDGLETTTASYAVDPDVVASGYSYYFYVRGKYRDYQVGSCLKLVKLCHELSVLDQLRDQNAAGEVLEGVGESVKNIGTGLGNLIIHPGLSLKSFGTRVRQAGRHLERSIGQDPKIGEDESGEDRSYLGKGPAGGERRRLAYEYGIDVYTDNPDIQRELIDLSQLRTAGGLATAAIPYHIGMLSRLNPLHGDEAAELRIRDYDPYELRRLVGNDLEPLFGMDREGGLSPLSRLLLNPNYSPRQIAYIGRDFLSLANVRNIAPVLENLADAGTPEEADLFTMELRLYAMFHARIAPLHEFVPFQEMFAAVGTDGLFYFLFTGDTVRPWRHTAAAFDNMIREAIQLRARDMEIWTIGDVDPAMAGNAAARGVTVRQNVLRDPRFMPAANR